MKPRKCHIQFLRSPVELKGNGKLEKVVFEKNALSGDPFKQKARELVKNMNKMLEYYLEALVTEVSLLMAFLFMMTGALFQMKTVELCKTINLFSNYILQDGLKEVQVELLGLIKPVQMKQ